MPQTGMWYRGRPVGIAQPQYTPRGARQRAGALILPLQAAPGAENPCVERWWNRGDAHRRGPRAQGGLGAHRGHYEHLCLAETFIGGGTAASAPWSARGGELCTPYCTCLSDQFRGSVVG